MRYQNVAAQSGHVHDIIDMAVNTLSALKDAETGQRGFLITLNPAYLDPYNSGILAWQTDVAELKRLTSDNTRLARLTGELAEAGTEKLDELALTIGMARERREAAFARVELGAGRKYMDDARGIANEIVTGEEIEFARLTRLSLAVERQTRWSVEAATAALFLLTLTGAVLLQREIVRERHLAGNLEKSEKQYRELAESLEEQVEQRTQELLRINDELQAFTYSVSHDLRAPLRAVDGFSQILLEDYANALDASGREFLERIRVGVKRMAQLIQSLLDLSRVNRVELRKQPVSISDLAASVVEGLRHAEPGRNVEVKIQPNLMAEGDPNLIGIVLDNLLSNAWKFTSGKPDARIEVGAGWRDGEKEFFVRDNGAGFDPAYAHKLFKPFQRLHSQSEFEGTGIGLATAQRVVRRHGGAMRAESNSGEGAVFYFTL